jgi:hypothetical protein
MIFYPPYNIAKRDHSIRYVFLAGSIEMGTAEDWQTKMGEFFNSHGWGAFNPRRKDWDNSWVQEYENPQFSQQVNWELDALEVSDMIILNLIPKTISPISLLELGLFADSKKIYVICPEGYWRKGNVEIVCHRKNIPLFDTSEDFMDHFKNVYTIKIK